MTDGIITDHHMRWFAARLSIAVYDTNADYYRQLWEDEMSTIAEQIKEAKARRANAVAAAGVAIAESVDAVGQLEQETAKLVKDTQDLRNEMAGLTNGGPALDEPPATPLPTQRGYPA